MTIGMSNGGHGDTSPQLPIAGGGGGALEGDQPLDTQVVMASEGHQDDERTDRGLVECKGTWP